MSWQNFLLSGFLRWNFKRRKPNYNLDDETIGLRTRKFLTNPRLIPKTLPKDVKISGFDSNGVKGEMIEREGFERDKILLYFHGGGYIGGSVETYRRMTMALAKRTKRRVFALDYRLAPEHRFPAAVEDGVNCYKHFLQEFAPENIAIAGDSAGGGLTLATLLKARDEGLPMPKAGICYSPYTDMTASGKTLDSNERTDVMFFAAGIRRSVKIYTGENDPRNPYASPVFADFTGLPPLQIFASEAEILLDDALRVAEKAKNDGVKVDLQVWKKLPHVWTIFVNLPESKKALQMTADFIGN